MSRLPSNTLQVGLAPDEVNLTAVERRISLRGVRTRTRYERIAAAPAGADAAPWRGAVEALGTALAGQARRPARACVVLSSRLVRYALVPWSDALRDADEESAYARHCFERLYGDAASAWELRVSSEREGAPKIASGVDAALPGALREVFATAGVRLDSIQPDLMAVYNAYRRRLQDRHAWLALLEPGSLCLALLYKKRWAQVRSMRIGAAWQAELARILEREAYLAGPEGTAREVFLCASGQGGVRLPDDGRWQFRLLAPEPRQGAVSAGAARVVMAAEG